MRLIQSSKYQKVSGQKNVEPLEDARDDVLNATKDEFFDWLRENGVRSIKKTQ